MKYIWVSLGCMALLLAGPLHALSELPPIDDSQFEKGVRDALNQRLVEMDAELSNAEDSQKGALWGELGQFLQAQNLELAAMVAYQNATELDPRQARWPYLQAVLASDAGDWDNAVRGLEQSLDLDPNYWPALVRLGRAWIALGEPDKAQKAFRRALVRRPDDATVLMGLGDIALADGDFDAAVRHYRLALASQPQANRLNYQLGIALRNQGDVEAARAALAQRGEQVPMMEDPWMVAVQAKNLNSDRFYQRGSDFASAGNYRAAVGQYEQAVAMGPDEPGYPAALAQALSAAGQPEQALEVASKAHTRWPQDPEIVFQMGIAYELLGDEQNAQKYFSEAFASTSPYPIAGIRLGHSLIRQHRWDEAIAIYQQVVDGYGVAPDASYWMAVALVMQGECGSAIPLMKSVLAANPSDPSYANGLARVLATCDGASQQGRVEALTAARALYQFRQDANHATTLAMALAANGQFAEAAQYQLQAISLSLSSASQQLLPWYNQLHAGFQSQRRAEQPWTLNHPALIPRLQFARS